MLLLFASWHLLRTASNRLVLEVFLQLVVMGNNKALFNGTVTSPGNQISGQAAYAAVATD